MRAVLATGLFALALGTPRGQQRCTVGEWEAWSLCSASCGGGTQRHGRVIVAPGYDCPRLEARRPCHTEPCVEFDVERRRLSRRGACSWQNGAGKTAPCTACTAPASRNGAGEYELKEPTPTSDRVCAALDVCGEFQYIMLDAGARAPRVCVNCPFGTKATAEHSACYAFLCNYVTCRHVEHTCSPFNTDASTRASSSMGHAVRDNWSMGVSGNGNQCEGAMRFVTTVTNHDAKRESVCQDGHWCGLGVATGDKSKCQCCPLSMKPPAPPAPATTTTAAPPTTRSEAQRLAAGQRAAPACPRGFSGHECACENGSGFSGRCDACTNGYHLASIAGQEQRICAPWAGSCAHGELVGQTYRTAEDECGSCEGGFFLSERRCIGWGGNCAHGALAVQGARDQENHCGHCDAGYDLSDRNCVAFGGTCTHGALAPLAERTQENHCGHCDAGYHLVGNACAAWGGSCAHGALVAQAQRTMANHCGHCDMGYFPMHFTTSAVCVGYGGECAHGALIAQARREQENHCGSCSAGFSLTAANACKIIKQDIHHGAAKIDLAV